MDQLLAHYKNGLQQLENWRFDENALCNVVCLTGAAVIVTALMWRTTRKNTTKRNRKPTMGEALKPSPMTKESHIENVLLRFEQEYKPGLLKLLQQYDPSDEKCKYDRRYYNEMLLKLLIELDGIDITSLQGERKVELKLKRKGAVKEIQQHLKLLDTLQ